MSNLNDLDLPDIDVFSLDRQAVLDAFDQARSQHRLRLHSPLSYALWRSSTAYRLPVSGRASRGAC